MWIWDWNLTCTWSLQEQNCIQNLDLDWFCMASLMRPWIRTRNVREPTKMSFRTGVKAGPPVGLAVRGKVCPSRGVATDTAQSLTCCRLDGEQRGRGTSKDLERLVRT